MVMASQNNVTKNGDIRMYMVSCMLFVCIVSGGAFLAMYVSLPESETASWYPAAGMILVGIPWIFWLLTLIYTWIKRIAGMGPTTTTTTPKNQLPTTPPTNVVGRTSGATTATTASAADDSPVGGAAGSGGGGGGSAGHVRFGPATVMGEEDHNLHNNDDQSLSSLDRDRELGDDQSTESSSSHIGTNMSISSSISRSGDVSSLGSHESELPLAFSMSS